MKVAHCPFCKSAYDADDLVHVAREPMPDAYIVCVVCATFLRIDFTDFTLHLVTPKQYLKLKKEQPEFIKVVHEMEREIIEKILLN